MKATIEKPEVTLTLSWEDANWLRDVMTNPLNGDIDSEEPVGDRRTRKELWQALTDSGVQHNFPLQWNV